jgi:hypothetical protein
MDNSELSREVIELGKRLVAEAGIDDHERDSLGRWLAHDIAQKMSDADRLTGPEGAAARDACAAAIYRLWEHRAVVPRTQRPFASIETAVQVLERLDLASSANRYFPEPQRHQSSDTWLSKAVAIDRAARVLLRACARLAVEDDGGRASAFVKLAEKAGLNHDPDMAFIRIILMSDGEDRPGDRAAKRRAEELKALKTFGKMAKALREAILAEEIAAKLEDEKAPRIEGDG